METLLHDLKYGVRMLRRSPAFTLIALFSLALGIGANTAIFSMIDVMMLKSMPVKDPQQLKLFTIVQSAYDPSTSFSYPLVDRFQARKDLFTGVVASAGGGRVHMNVAGGRDQTDLVRPDRVTGNFFNTLGINPVLGRVFDEDDDRKNDANAVVVLSYGFWKRKFGLDPNVIGRKITLDDTPFTIIGVTPPGFTGMEVGGNPDMWYPLWMIDRIDPVTDRADSMMEQRTSWWLRVIGRLKPGGSASQAQSEMNGILQQMLNEISAARTRPWTTADKNRFFDQKLVFEPGGAGYSHIRYKFIKPLYILMITVALVLLIACANVANLLLARAANRQKEIAVRLSIGASRGRLILQLLTESLLLALSGGVLGLLFSRVVTGLLATYVTSGQTFMTLDLTPDVRVLAFTLVVSVLTGILFGLALAFRATGFDLVPALKETSGNLRMGATRVALDKVLVIIQVALSLFLLIGAGLFVRTLQKLKNVDAGFDAENVLIFNLDTKPSYKLDQRVNLGRQLVARLETLPGARSASVSSFPMLSGSTMSNLVTIPGYTPSPEDNMACYTLSVGPRYFETMGIPLLMGREFNQRDDYGIGTVGAGSGQSAQRPSIKPVVINKTMADFFYGNENPIGKHFTASRTDYEIVGVVKDSKYRNLREKVNRTFYTPAFMSNYGVSTFFLRTFNNPTAAAAAAQQAAHELDKDAQILDVRTMEEMVDTSLAQERFVAQLAGFFSMFALLLASIGLYGIMSFGVVRRTKEMGIRMALGAQSGNVIWMVMRQSLLLVVIGVVIAIPAALATTRLISSSLFGLSATDPATIAIATFVLLAVAILAGFLPARRASRIDPIIALRYE